MCIWCSIQAAAGRCSCVYCGSAIQHGRPPTADEIRQSAHHPTSQPGSPPQPPIDPTVAIDQRVISALRRRFRPLDEITYLDLAFSNVNLDAIRHSLKRLAARGIVILSGQIKVPSRNRYRDQYQVALPAMAAQPAKGGSQAKSKEFGGRIRRSRAKVSSR